MVSTRGTHDKQCRFFGGLLLSSSLLLGAPLAVSHGRLPSTAATGPKGHWPGRTTASARIWAGVGSEEGVCSPRNTACAA
jgi:hypothetical protein